MIVIDVRHSHLFPGMKVGPMSEFPALEALDEPAGGPRPALVRFGDGMQAEGVIERAGRDRWRLVLERYRTAARTEIARRVWTLVATERPGEPRQVRVAPRRLQGG